MWPMIDSLRPLVEVLSPAFTAPSAATSSLLLLSWLMCLRLHFVQSANAQCRKFASRVEGDRIPPGLGPAAQPPWVSSPIYLSN